MTSTPGRKIQPSLATIRRACIRVALGIGVFGGCATNLLVGADAETGPDDDPETDPETGPDGAGDDGAGPTTGGGQHTDAGETMGLDATATATATMAEAGDASTTSTVDDTTSSTGASASSEDTAGPSCEADNDTACEELDGCTWQVKMELCTPTAAYCEPFGLNHCVAVAPCLWVGDLEGGEGECLPGPCEVFDSAVSCDEAPSCFWDAGEPEVCAPRACEELVLPVCEAEPECGLAGPEAESICVPGACLDGECFDLGFEMCLDGPGCDFIGEPGDGTCMILECLPCEQLGEEAQCNEVEACAWDPKRLACVG